MGNCALAGRGAAESIGHPGDRLVEWRPVIKRGDEIGDGVLAVRPEEVDPAHAVARHSARQCRARRSLGQRSFDRVVLAAAGVGLDHAAHRRHLSHAGQEPPGPNLDSLSPPQVRIH